MLEAQGLPSDIRVPFMYFGVDNSLAGSFQDDTRLLIFGQKLATGTAASGVVTQVFSNQQDQLFGAGSMLSDMIRVARKNNPTADVWVMPFDDVGAASEWTITPTLAVSPVVVPEVLQIMVAGQVYRITANIGDTDVEIADSLAAIINADLTAPVTAVAAAGVVTLTAKHAGEIAGQLDVRTEYARLQLMPSNNTTFAVTQTVVGSGVPNVAAAIPNLGEEEFEWVAFPYTDLVSLNAIIAEYSDTSGRWSALRQLWGHVISATSGTTAERVTLGSALNSQHLSVMGMYGAPTASYLVTAALAAKAHLHLSTASELSRPLQTLPLECVMPPEVADVDNVLTRNTLYANGIGGFVVSRDGKVQINRVLTTYQTNAWGAEDNSYLDIQTLAQLTYIIKYLNFRITQTFPRACLKGADEFTPPGTHVITPRRLTDYLAIWGVELAERLVIENVDRFISLLQVERDPDDVNALLIWVRPDLVNQFRIGKVLVQFFNEYPASAIPALETNGGIN